MGETESSERFEGEALCTADNVKEELGAILDRQTATQFKAEEKDVILEKWCRKEENRFFSFVDILRSQLDPKPKLLSMSEDVVLNRVIIRVLRRIQANRTNVPGGTPSYRETIDDYKDQAREDELFIRNQYHPYTRIRGEEAPPSIELEIKAQDDTTDEFLPGARIYVNDEWVSTTWKNGVVNVLLPAIDVDDDDPYSVQVKLVGYDDSAVQEINESETYLFRLTPS